MLAGYQARHAPRPAQYMPTDADVEALPSVPDFWNPAKNPTIRFICLAERVLHRKRSYALLASACSL